MIYVIEAKTDGKSIFKIGTTAHSPWKRLSQLRRQNAIGLDLVAGFVGDKTDEQMFHHAFKKWRLHGEWFSDCRAIRLLVADFPIELWEQTERDIAYGRINLQEAYTRLTLLKFEKPLMPWQID